MPTAAERQAVAFLVAVAVLGGGVRLLQARAFDRALDQAEVQSVSAQSALGGDDRAARAAGAQAFERQRAAVDSARAVRRSAATRDRAPTPTGPVDPDVAEARELETLPRIGPALAARIVANRDSFGPFGSLEELQRVRGIGPALARGLEERVTFSSGLRPLHGESRRPRSP
jgi:competence protein ComEA